MSFFKSFINTLNTRFHTTRFFVGMCITLLVISLQFITLTPIQNFIERVEGILYDVRLNTTLPDTPRQFDENIVIIDIDEKSMQEQGRYPWSRNKVAKLVERLHEEGVVVIAFDIFFAEHEQNPVNEILQSNSQLTPSFVEKLSELANSVDADNQFSKVLSNSEVVLGYLFDNNAKNTGYLPPSSINWQKNTSDASEISTFTHVLANIKPLQTSAMGAGFINSVPESDGFIRKASLVINYNNTLYPSLALEAARLYTLNDSINTITTSSQNFSWLQGLRFGKHIIPTSEKGQILIPFKGKARSFEYISATDVLNGRIPKNKLDGAIAFVGTSAVGLADLRTTSVGVQYPGVEIHANVFESLIHPEILTVEPDISLAASLLMLIITGVILAFSMTKQTPSNILFISLAAFILHITINWSLWVFIKFSFPLFQHLLLVALMTLYFASIGFMIENYKRKNIKGMFNQYVPPAYIDKLIKAGKSLSLESEKRNMSVLFADIRGFTQLSENFTPEELSEFMHIYLNEVTGIIFKNKGTIDKYVGDMVMAFWNAPLDDDEHATNAVSTALAMIDVSKSLSNTFKKRGWPAVKLGVGISSGEMNVGDMGSTYRKAYTVLGDRVNLGSRIESLTKYYGVDILITENTLSQITDKSMVFRPIDKIKVKGKNTAVHVYEPMGYKDELDEVKLNDLQQYLKGINAYNSGQWLDAIAIFTQLKKNQLGSVVLYDVYLQRLNHLRNSPSLSWDGVYTHKMK